MISLPSSSTLFPYTTLFRSGVQVEGERVGRARLRPGEEARAHRRAVLADRIGLHLDRRLRHVGPRKRQDRKSTRLNSSHVEISYADFCLKKKISKSIHKHHI